MKELPKFKPDRKVIIKSRMAGLNLANSCINDTVRLDKKAKRRKPI
jgi:hypothetical protein